ncbi:MAG: helix-turn-helix transcriptional regulator [Acidaminococcaceae bacterium]|nr:helix-turn-helix transcriptional regulator [Acidaminococcaceae bacterium]
MLQENVREYIALKIKEFRESMGWTKSRLAVTLDTTPRMITNWEQSFNSPSTQPRI